MATDSPQAAPAPVSRLSKRSIADALAGLDAAFKEPVGAARAKKRKTAAPPKTSTPALEALLSRSRTTSAAQPPSPPPASYDPTSLPLLLSRLSTYSLRTFSPSKPSSLSALSCALHGWTHTPSTKDRVQCVTCNRGVVLLPPSAKEGWTSPPGLKLKEEYEKATLSREAGESLHKESCPWRMRPCARSLYRLSGGGLGVQGGGGRRRLLQVVGEQAREMEERGLGGLGAQLPKEAEATIGSEGGRQRLIKAVQAVGEAHKVQQVELSHTTLLLAIFGWSLSATPTSSNPSRPSTPTLSRSTSSASLSSLSSLSSSSSTPILSCTYCHRQVLASSYLPSSTSTSTTPRLFDLTKQHQPYCPYVDTPSLQPPTTRPSASTAGTGAAVGTGTTALKPGWQVRLEAVLQRPLVAVPLGSDASESVAQSEGGTASAALGAGTERDKLVATGKTRELLSYVRSLLGPKSSGVQKKAPLPPMQRTTPTPTHNTTGSGDVE
ncbi:hypothetical protein JCM11641_004006 [Rhodosporidiobolus odoratus]